MNFGRRPSAARRSSSSSSSSTRIPSLVALDLEGVGLVGAEDRNRAGVGRGLADHGVAGVDERLGDEVDRLLAAGGDDHVLGVGRHPLGGHHLADAVLGLLEALGRPVLERLGRRLLRDPRHLRGEALRAGRSRCRAVPRRARSPPAAR